MRPRAPDRSVLSAAGVIKLQGALPKCQISVDGELQKALDELRKKKQP